MSVAYINARPKRSKREKLIEFAAKYQHLGPFVKQEETPLGKGEKVLAATCAVAGLTKETILGEVKKKGVVEARQAGQFVAYALTGMSLPRIGKLFNRDHTSVLHSVRVVESKLINSDSEMVNLVNAIKAEYRRLEDA